MKLKFLWLIIFVLASCSDAADNNNKNNTQTNNTNTTNNTNNTTDPPGEVHFSLTTSTVHGRFAPSSTSALWIMTPDGQFVRTLYLSGYHYDYYLRDWRSESDEDTTDAVTTATRHSHGTITAVWDMRDHNKNTVTGNSWIIRFEMTEDNFAGPDYSVNLTLDGSPLTITETFDYVNPFIIEYTPF